MKKIKYQIEEKFIDFEIKDWKKDDVLYFDIETTGLSAETSVIYLIGLIYYENNLPFYSAWFAENKEDEKQLLVDFYELSKRKITLICFNGSSFDLPFIKKKLDFFSPASDFSKNQIVDFYRVLSPFKTLFGLENRKQISFENLIEIKRKEDLSGKELIPYYSSYLKEKNKKKAEELLATLLKHNEFDLKGLFELTKLYFFADFFRKTKESPDTKVKIVREEEFLSLSLSLSFVPDFHVKNETGSCLGLRSKSEIILKIPVIHTELKFFYPEYKDYFYLPREDMAIHKDLAKFMDKKFRIKAEAKTAYVKRRDFFIRLPSEMINRFSKTFKKEYHDKISFISETDFFNSEILLFFKAYLKEFLD